MYGPFIKDVGLKTAFETTETSGRDDLQDEIVLVRAMAASVVERYSKMLTNPNDEVVALARGQIIDSIKRVAELVSTNAKIRSLSGAKTDLSADTVLTLLSEAGADATLIEKIKPQLKTNGNTVTVDVNFAI